MKAKIDKEKAERVYSKSIKLLKELQLKNGGILASPKGQRYAYVYPRDACIAILAFISAGMYYEARKGLEFLFKHQLRNGAFAQRYDSNGKDCSYKPIQQDCVGLVLYSYAKFFEKTKEKKFALKYWKNARKAVDYLKTKLTKKKGLIFADNSIHEFPPYEKGLEIFANAVCCAGIRDCYKQGKLFGKKAEELNKMSEKIRKGIERYLWNPRMKSFIKTIRIYESSSVEEYIDASALALVDYHVLDDNDKRIHSTVDRIERELWHKKLGGICRYKKFTGRNNGGYGPWPHFTLIMARHFIARKKREKAIKYFNWVLDISYEDLIPEHIATKEEFENWVTDFKSAGILREDRKLMLENTRKHPTFKKGIAYSVLPLMWAHADFIRTWNLIKQYII
ncbi:MAG: glycoside hydrolase family 15 protein [archaeon]